MAYLYLTLLAVSGSESLRLGNIPSRHGAQAGVHRVGMHNCADQYSDKLASTFAIHPASKIPWSTAPGTNGQIDKGSMLCIMLT